MKRLEKERLILPLILLIALLLRLRGIDFLVPYFQLGPDERIFVDGTLAMLRTGDLNPHFFTYGSFLFYCTLLLYFLYFTVVSAFGPGSFSGILAHASFSSPDFVLLFIGRFSSVCFGLGTICLTYLIGKRLWNRHTGFLAALFVAFNPFHISVSQIFKADSSLLFFILASLYFSLRILESGRMLSYLWAGICSGLALSSKYQFLTFLPLVTAHFLHEWAGKEEPPRTRTRRFLAVLFHHRLLVSLYALFLIFALTSPFVLLDWKNAWKDMYFSLFVEREMNVFQVNPSSPLYSRGIYQLVLLLPFLFSPLLYLAGIWGGVRIWIRQNRKAAVLCVFPIAYLFLSLVLTEVAHFQYYLPIFPFFALIGASITVEFLKKKEVFLRTVGIAVLSLTLFCYGRSLFIPPVTTLFHTYSRAGKWMDSHIPKRETVISHYWLFPATDRLAYPRGLEFRYRDVPTAEDIQRLQPQWVVLTYSSFFEDSRWRDDYPGFPELYRSFREEEKGEYRMVKEFRPPPLWLWTLPMVYPDLKDFRISVFQRRETGPVRGHHSDR